MSGSLRSLKRNVPYVRAELAALGRNLSLSVKAICLTVFTSYFLSFYPPAVEIVSVTPGYLLPPSFWVWTLFTAPFLEIHFWEVVIDIVTVGLCGKLIEPLWGTREMTLFFIIVNVAVCVMSVAYYLFLYAITFNPDILFNIKIHGLAGYVAAVSVSVKQIMPDHVLLRTPLGKITNRNVPLSVFLLSLFLYFIGMLEGVYACMFGWGMLCGWVYLRFYQAHGNGTRGDHADNFTFASFFPNVVQPPVALFANGVFAFFVRIGICRKAVKRFAEASGPSSISITLPGAEQHDAERRRQKALKLLSERLGKEKRESVSISVSPQDDSDSAPLLHSPNSPPPSLF